MDKCLERARYNRVVEDGVWKIRDNGEGGRSDAGLSQNRQLYTEEAVAHVSYCLL